MTRISLGLLWDCIPSSPELWEGVTVPAPPFHGAYGGHRRTTTVELSSTTTVDDLLFVDDCALNTVTEEDMHRSMDLFATGCANFSLTINTAKMVVMHQPPPSAEYNDCRINLNGAQIKSVETVASLGNMLSYNTRINDEVAQPISKASQTFGRLRAPMWNRQTEDVQGRRLEETPL
ncbi:unnamed protein product [Schistocephalus solidus]|uniref:Reverse transcriptase domain-containing protein n=1 Tax=Schistocephalus solidus TaxID=70667 RepID=A0A183T7B8_SCHSO|nr:unnamed protein product [Schistocephalus solidus]